MTRLRWKMKNSKPFFVWAMIVACSFTIVAGILLIALVALMGAL